MADVGGARPDGVIFDDVGSGRAAVVNDETAEPTLEQMRIAWLEMERLRLIRERDRALAEVEHGVRMVTLLVARRLDGSVLLGSQEIEGFDFDRATLHRFDTMDPPGVSLSVSEWEPEMTTERALQIEEDDPDGMR